MRVLREAITEAMRLQANESPATIRATARSTDLRIPQIGTFFPPLDGETDDCGETGYALGSHWSGNDERSIS